MAERLPFIICFLLTIEIWTAITRHVLSNDFATFSFEAKQIMYM